MAATLIVNPESGGGRAVRVAGTVAALLGADVPGLTAVVTAGPRETRERAARAVAERHDLVAVLGGDGTAHLVAQELAGTPTALAVVPTGSGNDLAAALGVPAEPAAAARAVAAAVRIGRRRRIDLGRVVGGGPGTAFTTVLCTGFDAAVTARANALRWPAGPRRYEAAVLAELAALRPRPVRVRTPEREVELDATLVAVANGPTYGGGLRIAPDARVDDGLLDVTAVGALSRRRLLRVFPLLRTGELDGVPEVTRLRATSVELLGRPDCPVSADGEPLGSLPCTVTCEARTLDVVC